MKRLGIVEHADHSIPLLGRRSLKSGVSQFEYQPHTLLVRFPPVIVPGSGRRSGTPTPPPTTPYHQSLVHEYTHWVQYNGSTVGALLSMIKYTQEQLTLGWFNEWCPKLRQVVWDSRFGAQSVPIIEMTYNGQLLPSRISDDHSFSIYRQMWHDQQLIGGTLLSSNVQDMIDWPRGEVFGTAMLDVIKAACDICRIGQFP